ncbi:helix-turn-helix domain-containing protein (plasmid) [Deinococcus taeanensis]|uniref:helix-turn-helix domain-containing protein n=1 Tax=Deinococcus taeanensis TaxID=2737050 RepID=UPI001CDC3893|nr:helix-turn-helix domain-containing protein [Deinococcus taeanensis]UBV45028.1 helix-turn-helix domain-containing protein [Deinococcus taeanensis]
MTPDPVPDETAMAVRLPALRAELGLAAGPDGEVTTLDEAARALPGVSAGALRAAFLRLSAARLRPQLPALRALLQDAQRALDSAQPEAALARWLAQVTGGQATVRSSWGDLVASEGDAPPGAEQYEVPLAFERRPVGTLHLQAAPGWGDLAALIADLLRLARLQAAAAGAARRRVGERQFETLLSGEPGAFAPGTRAVLAALRLTGPPARSARMREGREQQLDVLCSVGEGYFYRRNLTCLTTVRGELALWLWFTRDPQGEAAGLHAALLNATPRDFRLGVSQPHPDAALVRRALRQAEQALDEARGARSAVTFEHLDPLQSVLDSAARHALSEQLRARLLTTDPDGKLELTLRTYLAHSGSLAELAGTLNVHLNTLRYRLRRLEGVLGGPLSDPAVVTRAYLAFHATGTSGALRSTS